MTKSSLAVTIDVDSIDTGNVQRDKDVRSPMLFDAETFKTMTFRSRRVERKNENTFRVIGDLTIRDVTKETVLDVELGGMVTDPWGNRRAGFNATTSIARSEFGMVWNQVLEAGGVMVGDRVDIVIEVEAVSQGGQRAA